MNLANHSFNFLAGHTFQKERISYTSITATGFADDNIQSIAGGSSFTAKHHLDIWTMESYFSRVQYDYDAKYLFSAAIMGCMALPDLVVIIDGDIFLQFQRDGYLAKRTFSRLRR